MSRLLPGRPVSVDDALGRTPLTDMNISPETRRRLAIKAEVAKLYAPVHEAQRRAIGRLEAKLAKLERRR